MPKENKIVVRIPPSPTGYFHVGRARTALFNYLFAKKHGGKIIFRFEDTDRERSKPEFEEDILESLKWLGITFNEGPFKQSGRAGLCRKYIEKMLEEGSAYISKEAEGKNPEVIRFKNPNKKILFKDLVRGPVEFDTKELGDFIIARNIDDPLYHLAVVVDYFEMGITHIIRGEDGISNTPRQILIQEAIGAPRPEYAHVPLILAPDRSKLSGRHGAVSIRDYRAMGYLPEALVNYLVLLGWNPGTEKEIWSTAELIQAFDLSRIQKGGAIFDREKLNWINKEHIKLLPQEEQNARVRKSVMDEFGSAPKIDREGLVCPEKLRRSANVTYQDVAKHLEVVIGELEKLNEKNWSEESIKNALWDYATEKGRGIVLWAMRYALSGKEKSPDPFAIAGIIGKSETLSRLRHATTL
ncbi:MAG TPA: glutamate--tRNA ligase family protein [Candidatus Paceibacterota bacterium]